MKNQAKASAKPATPINEPSNSKNIPLKKIFCIVALVGIVLLAGLVAYRHDQHKKAIDLAYRADKVRFAGVDKLMRPVSANVISSLGKPALQNYGKICAHTSQKYSQGSLYCTISYDLSYESSSVQDYESLATKAYSSFTDSAFVASESSLLRSQTDIPKGLPIEIMFNDVNKLSCKLRTEYSKPAYNDDSGLVKSSNATLISFQCSGSVNKAIYPLAE